MAYKNNKFKISGPTWNEEIELPDGSYFVSDIQEYFEYILKKHGQKIDNSSIRIFVNKREKTVTFTIKTGQYLELLTLETLKITKDKNGENVPHLEITKVLLIHCNVFSNDYQQCLRVLYNLFGQLIDISPKFLKSLIQSLHILKYGLLIKILKLQR